MSRRGSALSLHALFEGGLVLKGVFAFLETISGLGLLAAPGGAIVHLVDWLTRAEIAQDPTDAMALHFRHAAEGLSIDAQKFYALYLFGHGVLKLVMVGALVRGFRWAYPFSLAVLAGFIVYQLHEWSLTRSPFLLALSAFDVVMCALIAREWRAAPRRPA